MSSVRPDVGLLQGACLFSSIITHVPGGGERLIAV